MARAGAAAGPRMPNGRLAIPSCICLMKPPPAASASPASSPTASTSVLRTGAPLLGCNTQGTVLHRSPSKPTLEDAMRAARRRFRAGERLDMSALAAEVGVNRVTLYRWVGSRDRLLVEVVWSLTQRALAAAAQDLDDRGGERIVALVTRFVALVLGDPGMQRWLADEGEHAMRLLTRADTGFQPRLIAAVEAELRREADA